MGENEEIVRRLCETLIEAKLQINYLHAKFKPTGTGNATLARIDDAIAAAEAALSPQVAPDLPMPPYPFQPLDETGGTNLRGRT